MDLQGPALARQGHSDTETPSVAPASFGRFTLARPVRTFTVGFEESGFDESPHARAVARHLGTEHHEMFVTAASTSIPRAAPKSPPSFRP